MCWACQSKPCLAWFTNTHRLGSVVLGLLRRVHRSTAFLPYFDEWAPEAGLYSLASVSGGLRHFLFETKQMHPVPAEPLHVMRFFRSLKVFRRL